MLEHYCPALTSDEHFVEIITQRDNIHISEIMNVINFSTKCSGEMQAKLVLSQYFIFF